MSYRLLFRREVSSEDMPALLQHIPPDEHPVVLDSLRSALAEIREDPARVGSACKYGLAGYRRHKFFTAVLRRPGDKPQGRIIYQVDEAAQAVTIEVIALRHGGESAYFRASTRAKP